MWKSSSERHHPDGRLIEPGALPYPEGEPEFAEAWAPGGGRPFGLEFLHCRGTCECWVVPCPCCIEGWVAVLPDGSEFGYRLAHEYGCSAGCDAPSVLLWHCWRCGLPLPRPAPDERAKRYAIGAIKRILQDIPEQPTLAQLRNAAFAAGRWIAAGGLDADGPARGLVSAAGRAGLTEKQILALADAMTLGRARPGRIPA